MCSPSVAGRIQDSPLRVATQYVMSSKGVDRPAGGPRYAEVAVEVPARPRLTAQTAPDWAYSEEPIGGTFHYLVPAPLQDRLQIGHWVWVPFGSRHLTGIVVALDTLPPEVDLREISDIIDERPVVGPAQLRLAQWISDYYLSPLFDCLQLFLPPGSSPRSKAVYRLVQRGAPRLSDRQRQVVEVLEAGSELSAGEIEDQIRQDAALGGSRRLNLPTTLRSLTTRGVIVKASRLARPRTGPQYRDYVRLAVEPDRAVRLLARSRARHASSRVLIALADAQEVGDPFVPLDRLLEASEADEGAISRLEKEGLVSRLPAEVLVDLRRPPASSEPATPPTDLPAWFGSGPRTLSELTAAGADPAAIARLVQDGTLVEHAIPESVALNLSAEEAWERVLDSANITAVRRALQVLLDQPGLLWQSDLTRLAQCGREPVETLVEAGVAHRETRRYYRDPFVPGPFEPEIPARLTPEQDEVLNPIIESLDRAEGGAFLLKGVTGSGKTEIYLRAIEHALSRGKQAIVLVPEISLTPQALRRYGARFPGRVMVQHSQLSDGERYDQWSQIRDGAADVVIGPRSALFAPLPDLGLIVVDEEHEPSYKQDRRPYYHAREVALKMARNAGVVTVLGSATPDVCTYRAAERGTLGFLTLPHRYGPNGSLEMPKVQVVDMRRELREGHTGLLSRPLLEALTTTLDREEQAILFLNRRGTATFVMCRDCGFVSECPRCDLPLTFHSRVPSEPEGPGRVSPAQRAVGRLTCHHCGLQAPPPTRCPQCSSPRIRYFGAGTERLQSYTAAAFPQARVVRWDRDTTRGKGDHDALLTLFMEHRADILIGTQMIAKGLDLPLVTLVGVVAADTALFFPDYRGGERAFQLLTQVAGRAGRRKLGGQAIVQTYHPDHYAIQAASRHDYEEFYARETESRRRLGYPPFGRMIRLLYVGNSAREVQAAARDLGDRLRLRIRQKGLPNLEVLGPAPCFYARLQGRHRWHLILRGQGGQELLREEPVPPGWRVDVDPLDFL